MGKAKLGLDVSALKREIFPEYFPPIQRGLKVVLQRLEYIRMLYADIHSTLEDEGDGKGIAGGGLAEKISAAKAAYESVDRAIKTVEEIEKGLKLGPIDVFLYGETMEKETQRTEGDQR